MTGAQPDLGRPSAHARRALVVGAVVFAAMAVWIATGASAGFDTAVMQAAPGLHGGVGDAIAVGVSRGLGFVGISAASVVAFVILMLRGRAGDALAFAGLMVVAALATFAIKAMAERPRPELFAWIDPAFGWSFPSGHALSNTAFWLGLAALIARPWAWAVGGAMALLAGAFRVVAGVHWPSDVIAGWAFGVVLVAAMVLVTGALSRRAAGPS